MTQTSTRQPSGALRAPSGARPAPPSDGARRLVETSGGGSAPTDGERAAPRIGPWTLRRQVGESKLARVYRVTPAAGDGVETPTGEGDYALKLLRPERKDSPEAVRCWLREAEAGTSVSHPRLLPVLAAHVAEPPYYVVTPWLDGATLADRLAAGWRPGLAAALWIARQTAEALAALDAAGWMHGDVKPENVHLSPRGRATLFDLGFARRTDERQRDAALDRLVLGTAAYLAPEAAASAGGADIRADLYSLGAMLFELLTGRRPFEEHDAGELLRRHCAERPPRVRQLAPATPREVDELVRALLAKQPLRRPQTADEVVRRLTTLEVAAFAARG